MYIVLYDKYLRDAKVVYFMTNICEMQGRAGWSKTKQKWEFCQTENYLN